MIHIFATYTEDWKPLVDLTAPLWDEYAKRHGYEFVLAKLPEPPANPPHISFLKTAGVATFMRSIPGNDLAFVIDLDMIPTNMTEPFKHRLGDVQPFDVAMAKDINGWNSGAYFIKPTEKGLCWLDCIVTMRDVTTSEQHAMWLINEPFGVKEMPGINSIPYHVYEGFNFERKDHYSQWKAGDFTLHLPGMTNAERIPILEDYSKLIIR